MLYAGQETQETVPTLQPSMFQWAWSETDNGIDATVNAPKRERLQCIYCTLASSKKMYIV